jgi:hypothetical protein
MFLILHAFGWWQALWRAQGDSLSLVWSREVRPVAMDMAHRGEVFLSAAFALGAIKQVWLMTCCCIRKALPRAAATASESDPPPSP